MSRNRLLRAIEDIEAQGAIAGFILFDEEMHMTLSLHVDANMQSVAFA